MRSSRCVVFGALALLAAGCSDQPSVSEKKPEKAAEPVTGQSALYRMYQVARSWASDAQVLTMNSMHVAELPDVHGKAGAWQATFVSESKNAARVYTYSVVEAEPNLHQGVFPSQPESWSGPGSGNKPFVIGAVKIDTDAAYKTALKNAAESARQNQQQTISFLLTKEAKFTNPSWRVIWGESAGTSGLSVYVDASTGSYLETMH
ncbi:MAG TPA: hypothetical protein VKT49_23950 [Bryobacteraceae bacterium]|nr:hypothetical protein [Bryobacteraceae bacterium]